MYSTMNKNHNISQSQFIENLIVIGIVGWIFNLFAGYWQPSTILNEIGITLYTVIKWALACIIGVAVISLSVLLAWYGPILWKRRKKSITRADIDIQLIHNELLSNKADIRAKFAKIENEQLKIQAELRQMTYVFEQITNNKQILAIDTNQADPLRHAQIFSAQQHPLIEDKQAQKSLPNVVDLMLKSQRMLLVAPSGSGKTNLLKHYISRLGDKRLIIIDPHSPNLVLGRDVIGAGLNFEAIRSCMLDIMHDISQGYEHGNIAQNGDLGKENVWLVIDEWRDILKNVGTLATEFLEQLLIRSRKRGYKVLLMNQNDTAKSWGLDGDMGLLQTCAKFSIKHDPVEETRQAFYGWTKSEMRELSMPNVFGGQLEIRSDQLIIEQAKIYDEIEEKILKAIIDLNGSANETSKNQILRLAKVGKNPKALKFIDRLRSN